MADVRSIVLSTDGLMKQVQASDSQTLAGTLTTASGNLVLAPAGDVEVAADKDLVLASGTGGVDLSAGSGAFKTPTGAVTISGSSVAIDSTGANDTLTIGANSNNITIGADGKLVTFAGDVQIEGAQTVVGETTFQQNATFEGDTTFGSDPADGDTVSFANVTIIGDFAFDGAGYKISNLKDPTAGSQEAATAKYVDDGLGLKLDLAGGTMSGSIDMGVTNKITSLASGSADSDAVNYGQIKNLVSSVSAAAPLVSSNGTTPEISIDTDGASNGDVLTFNAGAWAAAAPVLTPPGGAVNDVQLNDGDGGFTGSSSLTFVSGTGLTIGAITVPDTDGAAGQVLKTDGSGVLSWQNDTNLPAGSDTQVQFNNSGAFGASANLTWNGSALAVTGDVTVSANLKADGELWIDAEASLPAAAAGYGKLAVKSSGDGVLYFVDGAGQAHYAMPDGLNSLGSVSGNVTLDFDPALPAYRTLTVGGALTFQTPSSNLAAGRGMSLRLDNSAGGSARVLTFPSDWTWLAGSKPVQIEAGKVGIVSLVAYGTADTDVVAAWSYSDSVSITGGGTAGQVAYFDGTRTIKSEGGLAWDETNDRLNIGAADNATHSANLRVGGSAHIGGAVWLDGNVDLGDAAGDAITVNGAMSLASGASFSGVSGTVTLPTQFSIGTGNAVSANVTAANLNTLTGGSDASSLHTHTGAGAVIVALNTAANSLAAGDVVCADDAAALQVKKADADASQATARVLGVVESAGKVMLSGLALAKFAGSLSPAIGQPAYLSQTAGVLTNVAPSVGAISEVGIIVSIADYAGATKCMVALQVKAPIFLS